MNEGGSSNLAPGSRGTRGAAGTALVFVLLAAAAALGGAAIFLREFIRETPLPEHAVANRPIQVTDEGYTSSQTCQACHPDQYNTWYASYHRTMTQVATPDTARARFDGVTVDGVHGRPMRLERRGPELWAGFDDPDSSEPPDRRPRIERQVVMITGSHHQQVYWYATGRNRLLGQLPGAYLIREQRWIPRRAAVLHPPTDPAFSETGHWNSTCIACHATHGKPEFDTPFGSQPIDTQIVDTTVAELGIACEACHGPSGDHARTNRNPLRRYAQHLTEGPDATIVQPARLNPRLSSQACGQCHGIWEFYDRAGERAANSRGLPYRPGDELMRTRFVAQPTVNADSPPMKALLAADAGFIRDSFWADGMVRVSGREYNGLIESPCFKDAPPGHAERTLSCFSCHTMHKPATDPRPVSEWADDQLAAGMDGNAACLQCHQSYRANPTAHTRHGAESAGSSCYNCHMPYTTYGLLKTIRSHTISNPSVAESVETGRPNACNLCHLDKTLAWTSDALARWYDTPAVTVSDDDRSIAASLLWLLRGDAGQRAIAAQAMAWGPARQASGTDWMAPHLATLLDDPYDAVRFIAARSLRSLPGLGGVPYDFVAPQKERYQSQLRTLATWDRARPRPARTDTHLLFNGDGNVNVQGVLRLLKERNTRRVLLRE
jgi:hypothetical protein